MRILFVRHGNPNYELDCLTELGKMQAVAASERLCKEGIELIFSSSCGRAIETASYTAKKLGLDVTLCDFVREINWSSKDGTPVLQNGSPWLYAEEYIKANKCLVDTDWRKNELYSKTNTPSSLDNLSEGLDLWLESLGYKREGNYYRVIKPEFKTVAMFAHAGAFSCVVSHLFNLPLPFVLLCIPCVQTGVVEIMLDGKEGDIITPRFGTSYEIEHLKRANVQIT